MESVISTPTRLNRDREVPSGTRNHIKDPPAHRSPSQPKQLLPHRPGIRPIVGWPIHFSRGANVVHCSTRATSLGCNGGNSSPGSFLVQPDEDSLLHRRRVKVPPLPPVNRHTKKSDPVGSGGTLLNPGEGGVRGRLKPVGRKSLTHGANVRCSNNAAIVRRVLPLGCTEIADF